MMTDIKENTPRPLKENFVTCYNVTMLQDSNKIEGINIMAAYNFMRRGFTGAKLRNEVSRYVNFLKDREAAGNPIAHPENYLQQWRINYTDNNTSPADGAQIADLLEAAQCTDLDTICRVQRLNLAEDTLQVWLTIGTPDAIVSRLDEQMRRADMQPILERWQASRTECLTEQPKIITDNPTRARITYTMPMVIAEVLDNLPPAPDDTDPEHAERVAYLKEHHPQELQRIIDYVCKYKGKRNVQLFEQWKQDERRNLQRERWTDTQIIENKCAEIASREADALQYEKIRQFYEYYTQTL